MEVMNFINIFITVGIITSIFYVVYLLIRALKIYIDKNR